LLPNLSVRQFFRNAINNGLPVFECDTDQIACWSKPSALILGPASLSLAGRTHTAGASLCHQEILAILSLGGLIPFLKKIP
jgi:hypothetical protein